MLQRFPFFWRIQWDIFWLNYVILVHQTRPRGVSFGRLAGQTWYLVPTSTSEVNIFPIDQQKPTAAAFPVRSRWEMNIGCGWFLFHVIYIYMCDMYIYIYIWWNYNDLTRPHPKGHLLISGKSRVLKYYNLARYDTYDIYIYLGSCEV